MINYQRWCFLEARCPSFGGEFPFISREIQVGKLLVLFIIVIIIIITIIIIICLDWSCYLVSSLGYGRLADLEQSEVLILYRLVWLAKGAWW